MNNYLVKIIIDLGLEYFRVCRMVYMETLKQLVVGDRPNCTVKWIDRAHGTRTAITLYLINNLTGDIMDDPLLLQNLQTEEARVMLSIVAIERIAFRKY